MSPLPVTPSTSFLRKAFKAKGLLLLCDLRRTPSPFSPYYFLEALGKTRIASFARSYKSQWHMDIIWFAGNIEQWRLPGDPATGCQWRWHQCTRWWSFPNAVLCRDQQIFTDQPSLRAASSRHCSTFMSMFPADPFICLLLVVDG